MFSTCSELTPRAPIPDGRMERIMQPCGTLTYRHPQAQAHNQGEGKLTYPSLCSRPARYYEFCPFLYYLSLSFIVLV